MTEKFLLKTITYESKEQKHRTALNRKCLPGDIINSQECKAHNYVINLTHFTHALLPSNDLKSVWNKRACILSTCHATVSYTVHLTFLKTVF